MLLKFLRFYFSRTTRNGVVLRRAVKAEMPKVTHRPKPESHPILYPKDIKGES